MKKILFLFIFVILMLSSCLSPDHFKEEINKYYVTYMVEGDVYDKVLVKENTCLDFPSDPNKDGYIFNGWYNMGTKWEEEYTVSSSLVLTAKFRECEEFNITFMVNGEVFKIVTVLENSTIDYIEAPGEGFLGWYNGDYKFDFSTKISGNLILEARFNVPSFKRVDFVVLGDIIASFEFEEELKLDYIEPPYIENAHFVGWYVNGTLWEPSMVFTESAVVEAFYEYYSEVKVTFIVEGSIYEQYVIPSGSYVNYINPYDIMGLDFIGWYNGDYLFDFNNPVYSDIVLEARYSSNEKVNNIIDVIYGEIGNYTVEGSVVGTHSRGFVIDDGSAAIYVYSLGYLNDLNIGDYVRVSGDIRMRGQMKEFTNATYQAIGYGECIRGGYYLDEYNFTELNQICDSSSMCVELSGVLEQYGNGYRIYLGKYYVNLSYVNGIYDYMVGQQVYLKGYCISYSTKLYNLVVNQIYSLEEDIHNHIFENNICINCGSGYNQLLFDMYGYDKMIYTNNTENPYGVNLNEYGSSVNVMFYEGEYFEDPYVNMSSSEFYTNYYPASSYLDALYRTSHGFMSGDITPQSHLPESWVVKEDNVDVRCSTATYILDTSGNYIAYVINNIYGYDSIIYYGGAYTSLNEVAAYLLAFGEVPPNNNYDKGSSGRKQSVSVWGEYGRCNIGEFYGNTGSYPYEPDLPGNDYLYYIETDFGTVGGYSNVSPSKTYNQTIYNDGTKITRGAARFCFVSEGDKNIDNRFVFYTYNHYNDFQEYLNYYNGFGTRFGNESAGNQYCSSSSDYYNYAKYDITQYEGCYFKERYLF